MPANIKKMLYKDMPIGTKFKWNRKLLIKLNETEAGFLNSKQPDGTYATKQIMYERSAGQLLED